MEMIYLGIGSNIGDKQANLKRACSLIDNVVGEIFIKSAVYKSAPWGFSSVNVFLNMAIAVSAAIVPSELLRLIKSIESEMGRSQTGIGYNDRIVDIDILLYGNKIVNEADLVIPHALLHERLFVLKPLAEIAGDIIHPVLQKPIKQLLADCKDDSSVELTGLSL